MKANVQQVNNPQGRVDILLLRLGQHITSMLERRIEQRLGVQGVSLWPHVEPLMKREIKRRRIPARSLQPDEVVSLVLGSGPRQRRARCT